VEEERSQQPRISGARRCPFLASTWLGTRCVLLSPEDWRALRNNGRDVLRLCWGGGNGCTVKARVLASSAKNLSG